MAPPAHLNRFFILGLDPAHKAGSRVLREIFSIETRERGLGGLARVLQWLFVVLDRAFLFTVFASGLVLALRVRDGAHYHVVASAGADDPLRGPHSPSVAIMIAESIPWQERSLLLLYEFDALIVHPECDF